MIDRLAQRAFYKIARRMYMYLRRRHAPNVADVKNSLKEMRRAWLRLPQPEAKRVFTGDELSLAANSCALLLVGVGYLALFVPLTYAYSTSHNLNLVRTLLFIDIPKLLPQHFFDYLFPGLTYPEARPLLLSLCSSYGVIIVIGSFLVVTHDKAKLIVCAGGLYLGFLLTWLISGNVLHNIPPLKLNGLYVYTKFTYIMVLYYVCVVLTDNFSSAHVTREKYNMLFQGIYGIGATWLLAKYFGTNVIVFNGFLYLLLACISMSILEAVVITWLDGMIMLTGETKAEWTRLDAGYSCKDVWRFFEEGKKRHTSLFFVLTALYALWPVFLLVLYHYTVEGKA